MNDREFLIWIHQRLEYIYGERPIIDYMHKLRAIIKDTPKDKNTPSICTGNCLDDIINDSYDELPKDYEERIMEEIEEDDATPAVGFCLVMASIVVLGGLAVYFVF